ncbi:MAG: hypothetical protein ABIW76_19890 [Fibrobacteria bacterium]
MDAWRQWKHAGIPSLEALEVMGNSYLDSAHELHGHGFSYSVRTKEL